MYTSKILLLIFIFLTVWQGMNISFRLIRNLRIAQLQLVIFTIGIVGIIAYYYMK
jgi:hypothetical protein